MKKYYIDNEITGKQLPITFNTHERAKAFIKKHHFFGSITTIKSNWSDKEFCDYLCPICEWTEEED